VSIPTCISLPRFCVVPFFICLRCTMDIPLNLGTDMETCEQLGHIPHILLACESMMATLRHMTVCHATIPISLWALVNRVWCFGCHLQPPPFPPVLHAAPISTLCPPATPFLAPAKGACAVGSLALSLCFALQPTSLASFRLVQVFGTVIHVAWICPFVRLSLSGTVRSCKTVLGFEYPHLCIS
jgi:hypothetical protein